MSLARIGRPLNSSIRLDEIIAILTAAIGSLLAHCEVREAQAPYGDSHVPAERDAAWAGGCLPPRHSFLDIQPERSLTMAEKCGYACSAAPKLIFACSGTADVGAIANQAARKLTRDGAGKMYCLAGVGGRVSGIMATTQAAAKILAIDGCPLNCAKSTLEQAGFTGFEHLQMAGLGLEKGKTPVTEESIAKVAAKGAQMLVC